MIWQALGAALNLSMGVEALFHRWKMVEDSVSSWMRFSLREKYICKCTLAAKRRFSIWMYSIWVEVFYSVDDQGTWWHQQLKLRVVLPSIRVVNSSFDLWTCLNV